MTSATIHGVATFDLLTIDVQRAVVVEDGDELLGRHVISAAKRRHCSNECVIVFRLPRRACPTHFFGKILATSVSE